MVRAFVAVGSNIRPAYHVKAALRRLARVAGIAAVSTVYRTEPLGGRDQPPYLNCVVEVETQKTPEELRGALRRIEAELGRERSEDRYAPRTIDLDLILYDDLAVETGEMTLPDPEIAHRPFLAFPLAELDPSLVLPGSGIRVRDLAAGMAPEGMEPLAGYTEQLRRGVIHGSRESKAPGEGTARRDR